VKEIEARLTNGQMIDLRVPDNWSDEQISAKVREISAQSGQPQQGTPEAFAAHRQRMVENIPALERGFMGFGQGVKNVGMQLGNILGVVPDEDIQSMRTLNRPLMDTTAGTVGGVVGETAALAPAAGGTVGAVGKLASKAIPALRTASAARPIATGMGVGATEGALEGAVVGGPGRRGEGAAMGAIAGGLTGGLVPAFAKGFIRPTDDAQRLMDMGVNLTPGQMQPKGFANVVEQSLHSMSAAIREAGENPKLEFTQKLIQGSGPPGMPEIDAGDGRDMLQSVYDQYKTAYGKLDNMPVNPAIKQQLETGWRQAIDDPEVLAGDEERKLVERFLKNQASKLKKPNLNAKDVTSVRSKIRSKIAEAKRAQKWEVAELLGNAESALTESLNRGLSKNAATYNRAVDLQYARYKVAEDAFARMGDTREFPTSNQWSMAIKKGVPKGQYARGAGRMRPEVQAMGNVFRTASEPTGQRLATLGSMLGGGYGLYNMFDPMTLGLAGAAAMPLIATKGGRRAATGNTALQQSLQAVLQNFPELNVFPRGAAAIGYSGQEEKPNPLR